MSSTLPKVHRIQATRGWRGLNLSEVWAYRELLYFLGVREVLARYRQMALGPLWILIKPVGGVILFTIFFDGVLEMPSDGVPYPLFLYAALLPWILFSETATASSSSLVSYMKIISKVYFPRLIIPIVSAMSSLADFCIAFVVLVILMIVYAHPPPIQALFLPLFVLMGLAAALAVGMWLATLAVKYRDVSYFVGYLMQFWFWATPIVYPLSKVPEAWLPVYRLNPMVSVAEGMRWCLFGTGTPPDTYLAITATFVVVALVSGAYTFRRTERTVVDLL